MLSRVSIYLVFLLFEGISASPSLPIAHGKQGSFLPSTEAAIKHGPQIFNALHDAMRQFGSSIHHNGMSLFQATMPTGTILYHGSYSTDVPERLEWLAFEIEHAENFARGRLRRRDNASDIFMSDNASQKPLESRQPKVHHQLDDFRTTESSLDGSITVSRDRGRCFDKWNPDDCEFTSGYLHVFQALRPLNLLYIDGMAAAKSGMGSNDIEDFVVAGNRTRSFLEDFVRAAELCEWGEAWHIDGFIRMEPGFEVVYCNFRDGALQRLSVTRRPRQMFSMSDLMYDKFEWMRAASQRYHGFAAGRVVLDYSSMVSAYFYPLNLTNPNATRPELPRLLSATDAELAVIKAHLERKTPAARGETSSQGGTDWQGVTDMVVTRYADVLQLGSKCETVEAMKRFLDHLLMMYIDHEQDKVDLRKAEQSCAKHYLLGTVTTTPEEELIYAGILATTRLICDTLFRAYEVVQNSEPDVESLTEAVSLVQGLMDTLRWSKWKECGPCASNEICYVAMWPFGNTEDHFSPSCLNASSTFDRDSYWTWEWPYW
ncbi:hypothetical protein PFICI_13497 [Pestalotiopsis fici W106-1]|uniref:Uncharacterized protein n=1 Tax=Pestalotiopsis fici (strain W106-1 / CGMCC3.15140) TaxID=1229662 RepID=W3WMB4_PESFW|nr:uncharacterized protein PFICI_13497 [Pestalotiopsis fici W106-1]ETS75013.1 hypothetical protein PFICI_13497 [Pestalotiopsis fici W106-1]